MLKINKFILLTQESGFLLPCCLLLLYSMISGIYKIVDNQALMALNIPIVLLLLRKNNVKSILFQKYDIFFLFYIFYLLFLTVVSLLYSKTNINGVFIGLFLDIFPIVGFVCSRKMEFKFFF